MRTPTSTTQARVRGTARTKRTAQRMNGTTRGLLLLCICLAAVLVAPSTASAAEFGHFEGSMKGGGEIHFDTQIKKGKTTRVFADTFTRVPVSCDERNGLLNLQILDEPGLGIAGTHVYGDDPRVKHRSFRFTQEDQPDGPTVKFRGKLNKKGTKATGTYRAQGDFSLDGVIAHNCDTRTVAWSARKKPPTN